MKFQKGKSNNYYIKDGIAYIKITQGQETIVDIEFLDEVLKYRWYANYSSNKKNFYCLGNDNTGEKQKIISLHRFVWKLKNGPIPEGLQIDHINQNPLDNRIENLRMVTRTENQRNAKKNSRNTSGYRGVYFSKLNQKWHTLIGFEGNQKHLGYFNCIIKAALTYDRAAREFGFHPNHYNFNDEIYQELLIKHPI